MSILDLDERGQGNDELQVLQSPLQQDVLKWCQENNCKLSSFYKTLWSILLNIYTSSQEVTFNIQDEDPSDSNHEMICEVKISPETRISELLHANEQPGRVAPPNDKSHNTGVVVAPILDNLQHYHQKSKVKLVATATEICLVYSISVLSHWNAANIMSAAEKLVKQIMISQVTTISDLDLFTERHRQQVTTWNITGVDPRSEISPLEILSKQATERPDHEAICAWDTVLTYAQLDDISTRLALKLREKGVREESMVLACFEKTGWAVVSQIAILKAGGVFVPVSPAYPIERLKLIRDTVNAHLVVTTPDWTQLIQNLELEALPLSQEYISSLPTSTSISPGTESVLTLPPINGARAAYVIFTSGSTGRPKGVVVEHLSLARMVGQAMPLQIYSKSRVLQFAPSIFGASTADTLLPLLVGATLCVASQSDLMNGLGGVVSRFGVTWACMTPSAISAVDPCHVPELQTLVLVGEPVRASIQERWESQVNLLSGYGLTEHTVMALVSYLKTGTHPRNIGHSPTAKFWLADPADHRKPAPLGAVGEMLIDGKGLARGYLNDTEKTALMFLRAPEWIRTFYSFSSKPSRVLRTGDLARYQPDGSLVYYGRKDTQVKIRGKRVELSEVEGQMIINRPSNESVLVESGSLLNGDGFPVLVAFILSPNIPGEVSSISTVLKEPTEDFQEQISHLDLKMRASLPEFMVPHAYLPLAKIPKTPSGKTSRRELQLLIGELTQQQLEAYLVSKDCTNNRPRNSIETKLQGLFAQVLGRDFESFGINQDFLRLGGDSIKAMRLIQMCSDQELLLTVSDIMRSGTVSQLADIIGQQPSSIQPMELKPEEKLPMSEIATWIKQQGIDENDVEQTSLCSPIQEGILISQLRDPQQYALRVVYEVKPSVQSNETSINVDRLQHACNQLVMTHPMLRTVFATNLTPQTPAVQIQLSHGNASRIIKTNQDSELQAILLHSRDNAPPSRLPRFTIYVAFDCSIFVEIQLTHALVDGMSFSVITRDLARFYDGWEPSPIQFNFGNYMDHLRRALSAEAINYWQEYLQGFESCQFPTIKAQSETSGKLGNKETNFKAIPVDVGSVETYHAFSRETGITLGSVVKLAWSIVLKTYTRADDICFGYLTAGRDTPIQGIADAVAPIIHMMIFRNTIEQSSTVLDTLKMIQSDFVNCLSHQGVSLGQIRRSLNMKSDEVLFNTSEPIPRAKPS